MAQGRAVGWSTENSQKASEGVAEDLVRAELQRVLESEEFRTSKRSQDFLRYVVENTLSGHAEILKERTIGIEVFGRPASYDPSSDATVRVKAGEVRKRLGLYYASTGEADEIRIQLPPGGYIPDFRRHDLNEVQPVEHAPAWRAKFSRIQKLLLVFVAGVLVALLGNWFDTRRSSTIVDQFWGPVLQGSSPVLLCAAYVPVYTPDQDVNPPSSSRAKPEQFVLLNDQFVGGGDLQAVSEISSMLSRMHHGYRLMVGNDVSFQDLRSFPAILVGYSYTHWTQVSRELRFFIDVSKRPLGVTDNGVPTKWLLPNLKTDRHTDEDYAIVSRVFHPETRAMLVEIAGITQYGTAAAAELVTKPELLKEALGNAPIGWQNKNFQLVLHVNVIDGTPGSQNVVASYFW